MPLPLSVQESDTVALKSLPSSPLAADYTVSGSNFTTAFSLHRKMATQEQTIAYSNEQSEHCAEDTV